MNEVFHTEIFHLISKAKANNKTKNNKTTKKNGKENL